MFKRILNKVRKFIDKLASVIVFRSLNRTNKKFLWDIIPNHWEEVVYREETHWMVYCKRKDKIGPFGNYFDKQKELGDITNEIRKVFGENLIEITVMNSQGSEFMVFLKRNKFEKTEKIEV